MVRFGLGLGWVPTQNSLFLVTIYYFRSRNSAVNLTTRKRIFLELKKAVSFRSSRTKFQETSEDMIMRTHILAIFTWLVTSSADCFCFCFCKHSKARARTPRLHTHTPTHADFHLKCDCFRCHKCRATATQQHQDDLNDCTAFIWRCNSQTVVWRHILALHFLHCKQQQAVVAFACSPVSSSATCNWSLAATWSWCSSIACNPLVRELTLLT